MNKYFDSIMKFNWQAVTSRRMAHLNLMTLLSVLLLMSCSKEEDSTPEPEVPTTLITSNSTIYEKLPAKTIVAVLSTNIDDLAGLKYRLTAGEGDDHNDLFEIRSNILRTRSKFVYSEGNERSVRIQVNHGLDVYTTSLIVHIKEFEGVYPTLTSPSFEHNGSIPQSFGGDLANISPDLEIQDIPSGTKSMLLTMIDLDFNDALHWIVWNIPADMTRIFKGQEFASPAVVGRSDFGSGYIGPFPPVEHRYETSIYFLSSSLGEVDNTADVFQSIPGEVIAQASMIGKFKP